MFPVQEFTIGLWIHKKAVFKERQEVKGDFFGTTLHSVQMEKESKKMKK